MGPLRHGLLAVVAALTASACAEAHDGRAELTARSGTRLRLRWLESEGVRVVFGWHDAQIGSSCTVRRASDGELYCFPGAMQPRLFVDAQCADTARPVDRCITTPVEQATVSSSSRLDSPSMCLFAELYTVQPPEQLASYFFKLSDTVCSDQLWGPPQPVTAQRVVARVPESTLVHVTEVTTGTGIVQNRYLVGDDGSVLPVGFFDTRFGLCDPGVAPDGQTRCLPRATAGLSGTSFLDAACSLPAAIAATHSCDREGKTTLIRSVELNPDPGGCGEKIERFFELGEQVEQSFAGSECRALTRGPEQTAHRVGAAVDPSTFVQLEAAESGSGRLRISGWAVPGLQPMFGLANSYSVYTDAQFSLFSFADTQLSLSCSAAQTRDGALRCAPTPLAVTYADAACTRPVVHEPSSCASAVGPALARMESDGCHVSVHKVARQADALAMAFGRSGSQCIAFGNGAARGYALEEEVDAAMFARMNELVE